MGDKTDLHKVGPGTPGTPGMEDRDTSQARSSRSPRSSRLPRSSRSPDNLHRSSLHRLSSPKISFPNQSQGGDQDRNQAGPSDSIHSNFSESSGGSTITPARYSKSRGGGKPLARGYGSLDGEEVEGDVLMKRNNGLPKISRSCLWSEIKCYGRYMLPPLLVFGILVIGSSLVYVGVQRGWF